MCEDWPCCEHERGCCPDFDASGKQLNMRCVCGAVLPVDARYSICSSCINRMSTEDHYLDFEEDFIPDDEDSDELDRAEVEADVLDDQHIDWDIGGEG